MFGSDYIRTYSGVIPDEVCDSLIEFYEKYPEDVSVGKTMGGVRKSRKSLDLKLFDFKGEYPEESDTVDQAIASIDRAKELYCEDFPALRGIEMQLEIDPPSVKKYLQGIGVYKTHVDVGPKTMARQIAVVIYLNDVAEGGETMFPLQNVSIKPVKGTAAVFPTFWTFPHSSELAVSNDKFMISSHLQGV